MIVKGRSPASGCVAGSTRVAKAALVGIIGRMAGKAVAGSALENMVDMTFLAGDGHVLAIQFEGGQIMVVRGRCPASGVVAGSTGGAQASLVHILLCMAGIAVLRNRLEVRQQAGLDVAFCTQHLGMFPDQLERRLVVVKIMTKSIHAIVAVPAVTAEILAVGLQKGCVDLGVTGAADGLVETGVSLYVAIVATKE